MLDHVMVPTSWQVQLYKEIRIPESVRLCPTHLMHAELAVDAAVGSIVYGESTPFDRRQFGRELWSWAEDAAFWLLARRDELPEGFCWRIATDAAFITPGSTSTAT
jgi:hypothetical protein